MYFKLNTNIHFLLPSMIWMRKINLVRHTMLVYGKYREGVYIPHSMDRPATQHWVCWDDGEFIDRWEWEIDGKRTKEWANGSTHYYLDGGRYIGIYSRDAESSGYDYGIVYYDGSGTYGLGKEIPFKDVRDLMGWPEWYTNTTDEIMRDFTEEEKMLYLLTYR